MPLSIIKPTGSLLLGTTMPLDTQIIGLLGLCQQNRPGELDRLTGIRRECTVTLPGQTMLTKSLLEEDWVLFFV